MKNTLSISSIESYMANRAEKTASVKNVKTISEFGEIAQQIDFLKFITPEGATRYYIAVVHRGRTSDYSGKKLWIENRYLVTKEEGNRIYTEAKQGKTIAITE